ncbi:unnamed protein product [Trichobilharzia regenti]|nr:unnamed protein product [Trichobilharzia regenti]
MIIPIFCIFAWDAEELQISLITYRMLTIVHTENYQQSCIQTKILMTLLQKYDEVLKNGLPSWRTPVFYYRQLRRMSNYELFGLFFALATVIHYAVLWGSVFERRLTLVCKFSNQLSSSLKRHKARDRKLELINQEISDELKKIPGPGWKDILPFAIVKWIYAIVTFFPILFSFIKEMLFQKIQERRELKEEMRSK